MREVGTFDSPRWGRVTVKQGEYYNAALAIVLETRVEKLATLSVNLPGKSELLPRQYFYVKAWSENAEIAEEALASGLFKVRSDIPVGKFGFVTCEVWELLK